MVHTVDSGTVTVFSKLFSETFDSGSISIRCAFCQTTRSMINARNIMPDVVPKNIVIYNN